MLKEHTQMAEPKCSISHYMFFNKSKAEKLMRAKNALNILLS